MSNKILNLIYNPRIKEVVFKYTTDRSIKYYQMHEEEERKKKKTTPFFATLATLTCYASLTPDIQELLHKLIAILANSKPLWKDHELYKNTSSGCDLYHIKNITVRKHWKTHLLRLIQFTDYTRNYQKANSKRQKAQVTVINRFFCVE